MWCCLFFNIIFMQNKTILFFQNISFEKEKNIAILKTVTFCTLAVTEKAGNCCKKSYRNKKIIMMQN